MPKDEYRIHYDVIPDVVLANADAAKRHLDEEVDKWTVFLEKSQEINGLDHIQYSNIHSVRWTTVPSCFTSLMEKIGDVAEFNLSTRKRGGIFTMPPPSDSIEGQLILGLLSMERLEDSVAMYLWFISQKPNTHFHANQQPGILAERGKQLALAGYASAALPFRQVTSQQLAGAKRAAENHATALREEVGTAQEINSKHSNKLTAIRETLQARAGRIEGLFVRRERQRKTQFRSWVDSVDADVEKRFARAEHRLTALDRLNAEKQQAREEEFERLQDLFATQLRLRAPVKLWEARAEQHGKNAQAAFCAFVVLTALSVMTGALAPYFFGDYIAGSFFTDACGASKTPGCERMFSAKGPLTIAGLLFVMSLILWMIRLQYRVHLSERHLALDASEKQAFAETYLAMKEGEDVSADSEAIVLASLFRPTQDGIIKDDETAFDLSAAAILAKQLGRNN